MLTSVISIPGSKGKTLTPAGAYLTLGYALACLAIFNNAQHAEKLPDDCMLPGNYRQPIDQLTSEVERLKAKHTDKPPHHDTIEGAGQVRR